MFSQLKKEKGQIILVVLLVMAVGLTVGLSVAGRSLTDVRLSTQIDESSRAFSAAEAGIENILSQGLFGAAGSSQGTVGDSDYNVSVATLGGSSSIFAFPTAIEDGDSQTIWLVPHDATGPVETPTYTASDIEICWGDDGSIAAAVEVSILFKSGSDYKVARAAYDPDSSRISSTNNEFKPSSGACTQQGSIYNHHQTITFSDLDPAPSGILLALRLRPVYASSKIAVVPSAGITLPEQGKNISSTGKAGSGVSRRWNVVQTYSAPTDLFDYAVWSNTNLTK